MNKKIFVLLLILMAMFSVASVSAVEIANETSDMDALIDISADNVLSVDEEYDEPDGYAVGFFDNMSVVHLTNDEINWNVKNITEFDDYYNESYGIYLSTFKLNGVEYIIEDMVPTAGVYDNRIFITFNPNEYDVYDGIFYKIDNGIITDIIGVGEYKTYGGVYYRHVGNGIPSYDDYDENYYLIVNNECYKTGVLDFFYKAVEGTDYKIVDGEYYTLDNKKILHIHEDMGDDNYTIEFINDTYFITYYRGDWNQTYAEAIVNGAYLTSDDGFYYYSSYPMYALYFYDFIKLNNKFYRTVEGESDNSTDEDSWSKYALIDGKLYNLNLHYIGGDEESYGGGVISASLGDVIDLTVDSNYTIVAPDVTKYYGGSERFVITLLDANNKTVANKNVKITINGQTYAKVTNNNGKASIAIGLNSGKYSVTTGYGGLKVYSTVTVKDTIIASDFSKIYKNGTQYCGTFVDSKGNVLKNTEVTFNINGVMYTRKTNDLGIARMNINLNAGTYVLTATNPSTGEQHTTTITVLPNIVENKDLTKYYKNSSQYIVRLLDDTGKPVGKGVEVSFNINGVFYTRTTNENGYARLNINLGAGDYIITAEYKGHRESNKIKILPILKADDLYMTYRDGSQFKARLVDGQGNALANKTVTFNINGVFYQRTTGIDGIAKLNIKLMAGKYIITSSYNGCNIANEVLINSAEEFYYGMG